MIDRKDVSPKPLPPLCYLLLALLTTIILLPGRASLPPFDRDEARYMVATQQMLDSGKYIDIRFQDQPRYLQPAGIYWLQSASVYLSQPHDRSSTWPYRIPSLLAMVLAILATAWIGTTLFNRSTGLLSAGFLLFSVLIIAEGHLATIDSTLLLCILAAQIALLKARLDDKNSHRTSVSTAMLYWIAVGCGLMLKGPLILIPSLGTPFTLALIEWNIRWWKRLRPSWGWLITAALGLPWYIAIAIISKGTFFTSSVGTNLIGKIIHGQQSHGLPFGYYWSIFPLSFWPGAFFAAAAVPFVWKQKSDLRIKFLLCWIVPHWLFFEIIATKLPHYVMTTYPAISILAAAAITTSKKASYWPVTRIGKTLLGVYGLVCLLISIVICLSGSFAIYMIEGQISRIDIIAMTIVLTFLALTVIKLKQGSLVVSSLFAMTMAFFTYVNIFVVALPRLNSVWLSPRIVDFIKAKSSCPNPDLISTLYHEPSLVFLYGYRKTHLLGIEDGARSLIGHPGCNIALVGEQQKEAFLSKIKNAGRAVTLSGQIKGVNYSNGKQMILYLVELPLS